MIHKTVLSDVRYTTGKRRNDMSELLKVDNINVYYGSIHAIRNVSFHVDEGEIVTLIGANGAGKSTTLNCIAGLLKSDTGDIVFNGESLSKIPGFKIVNKGLSLVPEGRRIFLQMTVEENLQMGAFSNPENEQAGLERVFDLFPRRSEEHTV